MKRIIFLLFCVLSASILRGEESVKFNKSSWTEENGEMNMHLDINIIGCKDQSISVTAYFYTADGNKVKDTNGRYRAKDGQVATYVDLKPKYDNSHWEDLIISIPVSELHPLPGENHYYINFTVYKDNNVIGRISKACTYKLTGTTATNQSNNSHSGTNSSTCTICNGSGIKTCIICKGTGTNPIPAPIVNPYTHQIFYKYVQCNMCGGSGQQTCSLCKGTGIYVTPDFPTSSGVYYSAPNLDNGSGSSRIPCSRCGGSGICHGCGGGKGSWEYIDHYTGDGTKGYIPCGECRGSGKCPICYGRGTL